MKLVNRNILITGAASGIGKSMAMLCAKKHATLILWDRDPEGLKQCLSELPSTGPAPHRSYVIDLASREQIENTAKRTLEQVGPVDVLINNAGVVSGNALLQITAEQIERTFKVNTLAPIWTTRAFLPSMQRREAGHIVTIASAAGLVGAAKLSDYCASKFAAIGFDEALRVELKRNKSPIRTTIICPFYINTGMFTGVKTRFPLLLPILEGQYVAKKTIRAIEKDKATLMMPRILHLLPLLRLLPVPLFDALANFLGINHSMDDFIGRKTLSNDDRT
ncbi:MAG: SDR family oxidoreductase [Myxococcales bacterium]|nr:MAG: SDR family oxidoreductase [Myxococcales bacterium]